MWLQNYIIKILLLIIIKKLFIKHYPKICIFSTMSVTSMRCCVKGNIFKELNAK